MPAGRIPNPAIGLLSVRCHALSFTGYVRGLIRNQRLSKPAVWRRECTRCLNLLLRHLFKTDSCIELRIAVGNYQCHTPGLQLFQPEADEGLSDAPLLVQVATAMGGSM